MDQWKELGNAAKCNEIISAMVESLDMIHYLVEEAESYPDKFDYQVHIADHCISLYDDGYEFAAANTDGFKNPADFMSWVLLAINGYYYEEKGEEDE